MRYGKISSRTDHFVTATYIFVDLEKRIMRYAGTGHPLVMWLILTRSVEELEENGLVLGLFADATYLEIEVPMVARRLRRPLYGRYS